MRGAPAGRGGARAAAFLGLLGLVAAAGRPPGAAPGGAGAPEVGPWYPPALAALERAAEAAYNAGDFAKFAEGYSDDALLVAPLDETGAPGFVPRADIEGYLRATAGGVDDFAVSPVALTRGPGGTLFELGVSSSSADPDGTPYFLEWRPTAAAKGWEIAVEIVAAGAGPERVEAPPVQGWPTLDDIRLKEANLAAAFNNGDYEAMAALYSPLSHVVPPSADQFVSQPNMPAYFHSLAKMGVKDLQLEPVTVAEHGDAVHEIGVATHSLCLEGCFYYVRWHREGAGPYAYQALLDVQAIQ